MIRLRLALVSGLAVLAVSGATAQEIDSSVTTVAPAETIGTAQCVEQKETLAPLVPLDENVENVEVVRTPAPVPAVRQSTARRSPFGGLGVGLGLGYFYYREILPDGETMEFIGADSLDGRPKSTEHGLVEQLHIEYARSFGGGCGFVRPSGGAILGLFHTYDGSSQADTFSTSDGTVVAQYEPITDRKSNFFIHGGVDIGAGCLKREFGIAGYSGLELRLWKRAFKGSMSEYYYWANLPFGILAYVNAGPRVRFGIDARIAFMLGGDMQISFGRLERQYDVSVPPVTLSEYKDFGERYSGRVALPVEFMTRPTLSIRLTPWFEAYSFGKSNIDTLSVRDEYGYEEMAGPFYEPASETFWGGIEVMFVIHRRRAL